MSWAWLSKFPIMVKFLDNAALKWSEMRTAKEELDKIKKEKELFKDLLVKETQEKYQYKEQLERAHKLHAEQSTKLIDWVIDMVYNRIEERYFLVPKATNAYRAAAINLLGKTPPALPIALKKDA